MAQEQQKEPVTAEAEPAKETPKKEKKPKKNSEVESLKTELAQVKDLLARTAAEFDNYKKRTERERAGIAEYAKADVMKKLLPILDNVDRAAAYETTSAEYLKGVEMIIKQFATLQETLGMEEVAAKGDVFDPTCQEAVMHIEDASYGENEVAEVLQKGYKLGETLIRSAMVKVAN